MSQRIGLSVTSLLPGKRRLGLEAAGSAAADAGSERPAACDWPGSGLAGPAGAGAGAARGRHARARKALAGKLTSPLYSRAPVPSWAPGASPLGSCLQMVLRRRPGRTSGVGGGAQPAGIWPLEGEQAEKGGGQAKAGGAARTLPRPVQGARRSPHVAGVVESLPAALAPRLGAGSCAFLNSPVPQATSLAVELWAAHFQQRDCGFRMAFLSADGALDPRAVEWKL